MSKKAFKSRPNLICNNDGTWTGLIPDEETYEDLKAGKVDWKEEKKATMSYVVIPKDLFYRFMENEIMTEKWVAMGFIATEDDEDLIEED